MACIRGKSTWPLLAIGRTLATLLVLVGLGLAGPRAVQAQSDGDPLEPVNRAIFAFNDVVDGLFLAPAAELYGLLVPEPAKQVVRNFLGNLREPVVFANNAMQGKREAAGIAFGRFFVNSTFGVAGLFDMASQFGLDRGDGEDFGQTLGTYGIGDSPYIVLPILGPSNPRDAFGRVVDGFVLDPFGYVAPTEARMGRTAAEGIDTRYELDPLLDDLKSNSLDYYAALRSAYRQRRAAEIRDGSPPPSDGAYDSIFEEEFE